MPDRSLYSKQCFIFYSEITNTFHVHIYDVILQTWHVLVILEYVMKRHTEDRILFEKDICDRFLYYTPTLCCAWLVVQLGIGYCLH